MGQVLVTGSLVPKQALSPGHTQIHLPKPPAHSQAPAQPIHSALPSSLPVSTARPQRFPPFSVTRCLVIHGF